MVLGEWSYSFYLVHATVIYAVLAVVGSRSPSWAGLLWYPPLLAGCLGVAAALHLLVEKPAERSLRSRWDDRHPIATPRERDTSTQS